MVFSWGGCSFGGRGRSLRRRPRALRLMGRGGSGGTGGRRRGRGRGGASARGSGVKLRIRRGRRGVCVRRWRARGPYGPSRRRLLCRGKSGRGRRSARLLTTRMVSAHRSGMSVASGTDGVICIDELHELPVKPLPNSMRKKHVLQPRAEEEVPQPPSREKSSSKDAAGTICALRSCMSGVWC